ncbi:MAG: hypothetical protein ACOZIN_03965 [Myxococcota bacterium]
MSRPWLFFILLVFACRAGPPTVEESVEVTGQLSVVLEPDAARVAGASWRVDGGPWHTSGTSVELPPGVHQLEFSAVSHWTEPAPVLDYQQTQGATQLTQVYIRQFPEHTTDFFDATTVHPEAKGFQVADYDRTGRRVIFYPWGGIVTNPTSVVLAYHTDKDFLSASSYDAVDVSVLVSPDAQGFGTGFVDAAARWSYFVPFRKRLGTTVFQTANDLAVRFDLTKALSDVSAYETFRLSSLPVPPPSLGWITGTEANGHAYYLPYGTPLSGAPWHARHGILLRYETSKAFTDPAAWQWYDLTQIHAGAVGFQSIAAKPPWLYLIPYIDGQNGANVLVRYNLDQPFTESASYESVVLTSLHPGAIGYTGAIVAGDNLVLVPWRDMGETVQSEQSVSLAAVFDTRAALTDASAWSFFDLTTLHPDAKGYQFGWLDKLGFVHFVPTHNFALLGPPPFVVWDGARPFTSPSSWATYPNSGVAQTGAAYDGNFAWLAPYGRAGSSGQITRVRYDYSAP